MYSLPKDLAVMLTIAKVRMRLSVSKYKACPKSI
jgi:hypothetical protein